MTVYRPCGYLPRRLVGLALALVLGLATFGATPFDPTHGSLQSRTKDTAGADAPAVSAGQPPPTTQAPTTPTTQPGRASEPPTTPATQPLSTTGTATTPPIQPSPTTRTPTRNTSYSQEAVLLVIVILALLALLFWFLLKWSHRLDQASYLGSVYHESVQDFEYKRLATVPTEKLQKEEYHREITQDNDWLALHEQPRPPSVPDPFSRRGTRPPGLGLGSVVPPPGGLGRIGLQRGGDSPDQPMSPEDAEAQRLKIKEASQLWDDYDRANDDWRREVETEANLRYRKDLALARVQAQKRAELATDVDLSVLRGRGAEFVLEFTTVVVIIFAAVVLGVLDILGTEQIGTLLAAIAGYVLGRATTRGRSTADDRLVLVEGQRQKEKEKEKQTEKEKTGTGDQKAIGNAALKPN
jgi:hypothetical protein